MDISKKDWKIFREKLPDWQENYMENIIKDYVTLLSDNSRNASAKFWELEKRIKADKKHPGVILEMEKSETLWNIVDLIRLNVIAYDNLADFSDEFKQEVKRILELKKGFDC